MTVFAYLANKSSTADLMIHSRYKSTLIIPARTEPPCTHRHSNNLICLHFEVKCASQVPAAHWAQQTYFTLFTSLDNLLPAELDLCLESPWM